MSKFQEYVCGFLFFDSVIGEEVGKIKKVLLIEKTKPVWQAQNFNGIGGKVEPDEKPYDAMVREFHEEAGLRIMNWKHFCIIESDHYRVHFYKSFIDVIQPWESKTEEKVASFYVHDLPANLVRSLNILIPLAQQSEFTSTIITESQ